MPLEQLIVPPDRVRSDALRAHYIVAIGEACDHARTGAMPVAAVAADGRVLVGVPRTHPVPDGHPDELCGTGYARDLDIDGQVMALDDVVELRLPRP